MSQGFKLASPVLCRLRFRTFLVALGRLLRHLTPNAYGKKPNHAKAKFENEAKGYKSCATHKYGQRMQKIFVTKSDFTNVLFFSLDECH